MSKGGFGSAKPLPGQPGYRVSASQALEKEAMEMEKRLKMLQERMASEEEIPKKGGDSHWKTARTDRGGMTTYAKDVQEKNKKRPTQRPDPATKATAAVRRTNRLVNSSGGFDNKDIDHWTVSDVGDWLDSTLLSQYKDVFVKNQISGPILLDISLEDLDYMSVTALGHRKIILKGIEDLRQNRRVTKQLFAPSEEAPRASRSQEGRAAAAPHSTSLAMDSAQTKHVPPPKVHWSALEPISSNKVSGADEYDMVNGADSGMLDEEAERRAFQEAVMAWRTGGGTTEKGGHTLSLTSYGKSNDAGSSDNGMWSNPFGENVDSEVGMGLYDDKEIIVSARGVSSDVPSKAYRHNEGAQSGKSLADGSLDEEREQAEFRAAVEAWRTGKPNPTIGKSTAQKIADDMDRDLKQSSKKLQEDQDSVRKRIEEANRTLAEAKRQLAEKSSQSVEVAGQYDEDLLMEDYSPTSPQDSRGYLNDDCRLSPTLSMGDSDDEDEQMQSHVEVALLESTLNTGDVRVSSSSVQYLVAEPSSDEEDEYDEGKDERGNNWRGCGGVEVHEIS